MKRTAIIAVFLLLPFVARAQFYTVGDDPSSVKWYRINTETYKIIYPEGLDSLALEYASALEKYKRAVGRSVGYVPGEWTCGKIPVILHAFNAASNGSVAWAPKQVNLYTTPQACGAEPMPWVNMLAIHEQRHVAQMQAGLSGVFRPFGWIFGEMFNGLVAGLYPSNAILEGDAVVAETALSKSGRGRSGDFLNYYMIAFDNGDFRSLNKWRFGSQKHYTPNHYAIGYLYLSGIRHFYDVPDFSARYFHHIARRPYDFNALYNVIKKTTGDKAKVVFENIAHGMHEIWTEEMDARRPFTPYSSTVGTPSRYTVFSSPAVTPEGMYAVRSGITRPAALVRVSDKGKVHTVRSFASNASRLSPSPGGERLYWSETVPDKRWSMRINSVIRYYDTTEGRSKSITSKGRLFSPSVDGSGKYICVTEYYDNGKSGIAVLDADSGKRICEKRAPDSVQVVQSAWQAAYGEGQREGKIFVTGISSDGYGLYSVGISLGGSPEFGSSWDNVLAPQPVKITDFKAKDNLLAFVSDRTGVEEVYVFDPSSGELRQRTSSRYGASEFDFSPDGDSLYWTLRQYAGILPAKTATDRLMDKTVSFSDIHTYPVAETLSLQEVKLAAAEAEADSFEANVLLKNGVQDDAASEKDLSPKRYRKFPNLFKIHSWAPAYFNVDKLRAFSYDHFYEMLSPGLAAVSQNELGTAITQFGYSAHKDPYGTSRWRHSGHLSFTWSGWYPVIEASVDYNDRAARATAYDIYCVDWNPYSINGGSDATGKNYIIGNISIYIPFNFSRGGWSIGLVPRISYSISNDTFTTGFDLYNRLSLDNPMTEEDETQYSYWRSTDRKTLPVQQVSSSLRFYAMRPTANSGVYPRWGIGLETGATTMPGLGEWWSPMSYAYIYAYTPGIIPQHGMHFSALGQTILSGRAMFGGQAVNILPRGLSRNAALASSVSHYSEQALRLTADYALPISLGDVALGTFMFFRRLIINPHFDMCLFDWMDNTALHGHLYSVGASVTIDLERFFWLRFPFSVGVSASYNSGSAFDSLAGMVQGVNHWYVGPVFSVDL